MSLRSSVKNWTLRIKALLTKKVPMALILGLFVLLLAPYLVQYLTRNKIVLDLPEAPTKKALGIKELISDVKSELSQLEYDRIRNHEVALFQVTNFDLEISFLVRASSQQKGGIEYQIVTADTQIEHGVEKIQKLTLHMTATKEQHSEYGPASWPSDEEQNGATSVDTPPVSKGENR